MNFSFMNNYPKFKKLQGLCVDTEDLVLSKPELSAISSRKAMEYIVKFLYTGNIDEFADNLSVFEMLNDYHFRQYINDETLLGTMHYIRKIGNAAAHDNVINKEESLSVLEHLHFLVGEFFIMLGLVQDYPEFEKPGEEKPVEETKNVNEAPVEVSKELVKEFAERMRNTRFNTEANRDPNENKKLFLHASFREAGWPIANVSNQLMPNCACLSITLDDGTNIDYVITGKDNKPLAIVEYTSTLNSIVEGRLMAIEKARKLEAKYGYKPIAYYTNGYNIFVIDQLGYPPRRVFDFHSIDELELLKLRQTIRVDISNPVISDSITNRKYQKEAIKAACNAFSDKRRRSLLVMATGTGKTRVSISLVEVLMKANWVKNVLFLADRTSLVRQANKNFTKLLPNVTTSVYAGGSFERDQNARIIFSTYQTMINLINDETREFGIGRFDLIIVDEAHRSIFKKYSALFRYFDSLMIGLTATPRNEDDKSTYEMFELPESTPDYAYELDTAIRDGYLVGFSVMDRTTDSLRRGVYYDDLTEEQKRIFEEAYSNSEEAPSSYYGTVLSSNDVRDTHVINLGTIDVMLNDLMKNGLKVNGGETLGKTIIFASNHVEAEKIVERFQNVYSYLDRDFCKVIDSQIPNNLSLIDSFSERDGLPQIAVSVDMMDTGIDVPDVLNLVFFKTVRSKIKFLQMVGRGTRLSPDVYGPGINKEGFLIFDYYDNFRFFKTHNTWSTINAKSNGTAFTITPQSILINERKLNILARFSKMSGLTGFNLKYKNALKDYFVMTTRSLCNDDIDVQYNMAYVNKYRVEEEWDSFSTAKMDEIKRKILPLFPPEDSAVKVKNFDLMMFVLEDEIPKRYEEGKDIKKIKHGFGNIAGHINEMLNKLEKLKTIPAIVQKELLIKSMKNADRIFNHFSLEDCEYVRKELRELMRYIPDDSKYYIIDSNDFVIGIDGSSGATKEKTYLEKVNEYIQKGNVALSKLRNLDELTDEEKSMLENDFTQKLGSSADYVGWSNNKPLLPFLRMQVGISDDAINTKFGSFLNDKVLNEQQLIYMNQIISYCKENGDIVTLDLQRVSPLCDVDVVGLFGQNIIYIKNLINGLHKPVM